MVAAIGSFIAGPNTATYAAGDLGIIERGYTVEFSYAMELITNTDAYADTVIDGVYRGGNAFIQGNSKEYKTSVMNAVTPWSQMAATGASSLGPGQVGRLASNIAGNLVMSAVSGTTAANAPASLTANAAILAENFNVNWIVGPEHRRVPFRFRLLPNGATPKWFSTT